MLQIHPSQKIEEKCKKSHIPNEVTKKSILDAMNGENIIEDMEDTNLALERLRNPGKIWTQEEVEAEILGGDKE